MTDTKTWQNFTIKWATILPKKMREIGITMRQFKLSINIIHAENAKRPFCENICNGLIGSMGGSFNCQIDNWNQQAIFLCFVIEECQDDIDDVEKVATAINNAIIIENERWIKEARKAQQMAIKAITSCASA